MTTRSAGTIINHHICSDIPSDDIHFLLDLVQVKFPQAASKSSPQSNQDPVPQGGQYSEQACSYWPTQSSANSSIQLGEKLQVPSSEETIKSNLRSILNAFSLLLSHHPLLFPLFVILMRHPALATDPFRVLPEETLVPISMLNSPLTANHPLYQSEPVDQFLLSLSRLLLVSPHLPYPGLVLQGTRQLAWYCWRFWQGPAFSSQLTKKVRDQYVWQRNSSELSPLEEHFTSPWSEQSPQNTKTDQDTLMDPVIDSSSDDMITVEDQLSFKWNVHFSGSSTQSAFSYEVVSRAIDAWVLEVDGSQRISQLKSHYQSDTVEKNADLPLLLLQESHFSQLITSIQGNLVLKSHALPGPASMSNLLPATETNLPQPERQLQSYLIPHEAPFVSTSSSLVALKSLSGHISARFPVLLSGPPSSGKNTIIQKLACHLWSTNLWSTKPTGDQSIIDQTEFDRNVVILNLASRTLDAKSLVGSYVSSTKDPRKFVFVEGPLLRAMKEGKWLVCQDIDRASDYEIGGGYGGHGGPNGVGIDLGAQAGWVSANERFLLLATRTCQHERAKSFVGEQYWKEVVISSMTKDDILNVVTRQTPSFSQDVRDRLVSAWEEVSSSQPDTSRRRPIQLIDLLKWVA
ncbi:hypothetical protein Pst134EA_006712 [Puccinia striiformis f. sp. tritici]|uniref:hypothetical protein n=1 Tax=Puccinia striiformis f. sp. tritici TaxID=168172 RepID=UPI00200899D8|nr:hypothetical protein Pst134EA_006712 [Puccinia striiformis f. sp. tritici]KAH9469422.1 hypothetical protein Pst134EA_006712 [Puccinia striiformis f. sp. tritici]